MEDNFTSIRSEGIVKTNYLLKRARNNTARDFIYAYVNADNKGAIEVKRTAFLHNIACRGSLTNFVSDSVVEILTEEDVTNIYKAVKEKSGSNFKKFYESYMRKIEKGYYKEFVDNAFSDLKVAYSAYRKANNPLWNLEDSQITEAEMKNLYCLLMPVKDNQSINQKTVDEK